MGARDRAHEVAVLAAILSKIGYGHPEIDASKRWTYGLNRVFALELMARLDTLFDPKAIAGLRYSAQSLSEVDTEEFAV